MLLNLLILDFWFLIFALILAGKLQNHSNIHTQVHVAVIKCCTISNNKKNISKEFLLFLCVRVVPVLVSVSKY